MTLKVLLLNFRKEEINKIPDNIAIEEATIDECPTLHDFHVIMIDTADVFNGKFWKINGLGYIQPEKNLIQSEDVQKYYRDRVKEQIETGGITICFSSEQKETYVINPNYPVDNYFFCPIDLGIKNGRGDTFYLKSEELKYFSPLLSQVDIKEIRWQCYFSKVPNGSRVLGVNRAGYAVFMETPLGAGKLVMLPRFADRAKASTTIINEVIPKMIHEEGFTFVPPWSTDFSSPLEKQTRDVLTEIEKTKRLLFTKDKALKKAVASVFKRLGFDVEILPDGTLPDLRISEGEQRAIVEVKGHENRATERKDGLQLLGYLSEENIEEKGIVVSNHDFNKEPNKRSKKAFTEGAIQLGEKMSISLISAIDLYELSMRILEKRMDEKVIVEKRKKIMTCSGLTPLL